MFRHNFCFYKKKFVERSIRIRIRVISDAMCTNALQAVVKMCPWWIYFYINEYVHDE